MVEHLEGSSAAPKVASLAASLVRRSAASSADAMAVTLGGSRAVCSVGRWACGRGVRTAVQ